jgi:hypothetical protein
MSWNCLAYLYLKSTSFGLPEWNKAALVHLITHEKENNFSSIGKKLDKF